MDISTIINANILSLVDALKAAADAVLEFDMEDTAQEYVDALEAKNKATNSLNSAVEEAAMDYLYTNGINIFTDAEIPFYTVKYNSKTKSNDIKVGYRLFNLEAWMKKAYSDEQAKTVRTALEDARRILSGYAVNVVYGTRMDSATFKKAWADMFPGFEATLHTMGKNPAIASVQRLWDAMGISATADKATAMEFITFGNVVGITASKNKCKICNGEQFAAIAVSIAVKAVSGEKKFDISK